MYTKAVIAIFLQHANCCYCFTETNRHLVLSNLNEIFNNRI
jgi:hypothetical protein